MWFRGSAVSLVAMMVVLACDVHVADASQPSISSTAEAYERVSAAVADAMVQVKFVVTVDAPWGGESADQEMEADGVLVSDAGLVLLGNSAMGGWAAMFSDVQLTPRDVKVLIGDDTEGVPATVLARDTDRDLCWVQIDDAPVAPLPFVDIHNEADIALGSTLYQVSRLGEFFGRALVVAESIVNGRLSKPRELLHVSQVSFTPGLPVFRGDGSFAGFAIVQLPADEEMSMDGGFGGGGFDSVILAVLPAADVAAATDAALAMADEEE